MEVWKEVYGFDVLYEVSNLGRIRTKFAEGGGYRAEYRILTPTDNGNGYLRFNWSLKGRPKTVYLHRLVAEAFVKNPFGYNEVNHLDENKKNNAAENLEWTTHKLNCQHGTRNERVAAKTSKAVICVENGIVYRSIREAAKELDVAITAISNCLNGRSKTCRGYHWKYA